MNPILNTPLLTSASVKQNFDNKIIMFFVVLLSVLVLLVVLFFDITATLGSSTAPEPAEPAESTPRSILT